MVWLLLFLVAYAQAQSTCQNAGQYQCSDCLEGTYDHDKDISTACIKCPRGYYQDEIATTLCKQCEPGSQSALGSSSCQSIDYCGTQNNMMPIVPHKCAYGTCQTNDEGYSCVCESGWSGEYCHERVDCHKSTVWDGSQCIQCDKYPFGNAACVDGVACDVDPCNGGLCVDTIGNYTCICPPGTYGSMCQLEEGVPCKHGEVVNGVCVCNAEYYGDMCEYNTMCPETSIRTSIGCLDLPECDQEASLSNPCLCNDTIITDGYCHNNQYVETCVLGAKDCYYQNEICAFFNGEECVDYLYPGCNDPLYAEYTDTVSATLSTCRTPIFESIELGTQPCDVNSDCEFGCIFGTCGKITCSEHHYWNGTMCLEYSNCNPGHGASVTGYADVVCEPCNDDQWTNRYLCEDFSDMSNCNFETSYWERGNSSTDNQCYPKKECDKTIENIEIQVGYECEECYGYGVRDSETNKEICTAFTTCGDTQYANVSGVNIDITCVDRRDCNGLEELKLTSPFTDSICLGADVPECVKEGVDSDLVNFLSKVDLITDGRLSKENAVIAMNCPDGTEFTYSIYDYKVAIVKGDISLDHLDKTIAYYRNSQVDSVTPTGLRASCTDYGICVDTFEEHDKGCLHGFVNGSDCIECLYGVSGERCDQVASCDDCEFGSCEGDIFSCSCYEGAEGLFCTNINDCGDCGFGKCTDGNGTYTCDCDPHAYSIEIDPYDNDYCAFNCSYCEHCESCDDSGATCSSNWEGDLCDTCAEGYEVDGDNCTICKAGTFDHDSDSSTKCSGCPNGWASTEGAFMCTALDCVYSSGVTSAGCVCLDGWSGDNCDTCNDGETVELANNNMGICQNNSYVCPFGRKGDNCAECDGVGCGDSQVQRLKDVINIDVDTVTAGNSRSKAWGRTSSPKVKRQRKKELLAQFLSTESEIILTPSERDSAEVCSMSVRADCSKISRNVRLVPVKTFSRKEAKKCDVTLSDYTIVFGLIDDGDQMTVCDTGGNILFHQELTNAENNTYDISKYNGVFYADAAPYSEGDELVLDGYNITIANLEAVVDENPCDACTELQACEENGGSYQCVSGCDNSPCGHGTCENTQGGGFNCTCYEGWDKTEGICDVDINYCNGQCSPGQCVEKNNTFECDCAGSGYDIGANGLCNVNIDNCDPDPCNGRGNCTDHVNGHTCECNEGYLGSACEEETIECPDDCKNGGQCIEKHLAFECNCTGTGYDTDSDGLCNVNIDNCDPDPCNGRGNCTDDVNGYTCVCEEDFYGNECEHEYDQCSTVVCQNGGNCTGGVCDCTGTGFNGTHCQHDVVDCPKDCGHGTCEDIPGSYKCNCYDGWETGDNGQCTVDKDYCTTDICGDHGSCQESNSSYTCDCGDGFSTSQDGESCVCGLGKGYNSTSGQCEQCLEQDYNMGYTYEQPCVCHDFCDESVDMCTPDGEKISVTELNGKYVIDGMTAPPLELKIGETYTFIHPSGHPFRVKAGDTIVGSVESTTEYMVTITGDETEYICSQHSNMGNTISTVPYLCHQGAECVTLLEDYRCECPVGFLGKNCETTHEDFCASASESGNNVDYINYQCCSLSC